MAIDDDWRLTSLLVHMCPDGSNAESFLVWLERLSTGDLYELISEYCNQFPDNMGHFRSKTLSVFSQWNDQYFKHIDPRILESLGDEARNRKKEQSDLNPEEFVDQTTNGLLFAAMNGLEKLILIPQYHFQPINYICYFGKITLCHYSAKLDFSDEKSRLKILRYLHKGPRSFIEIARHLELSKGITHDHITKLRSAGLIHAHIEGDTLTAYSLRSKALQHMQNKLKAYIEQA
jgi:DNA-binding transcriptional ArsR family regulator